MQLLWQFFSSNSSKYQKVFFTYIEQLFATQKPFALFCIIFHFFVKPSRSVGDFFIEGIRKEKPLPKKKEKVILLHLTKQQ